MTVIIPLASSNLAAANIVKTLSIRFEFDVGIHTIIDLALFKKHEKLVEAIFGEYLNYKGGLRVS